MGSHSIVNTLITVDCYRSTSAISGGEIFPMSPTCPCFPISFPQRHIVESNLFGKGKAQTHKNIDTSVKP